MTIGMQMFLLAAQELNFTKAAEKAYVTPQCLSDHIKRLELEFGVTLFERRPRLMLTPEGEAMRRYLTEIQRLETDMINELSGVRNGIRGTIRLGIPMTRGQIFVPKVVPIFQTQYPQVRVDVRLGDTRELEPLLEDGKLDIMMGVAASPNPMFDRVYICREPLCTVVPETLLREKYGEDTPTMLASFAKTGIPLSELATYPLVLGNGSSTTMAAIQELLLTQGLPVNNPIVVSNFDIHMDLCLSGRYATICLLSNIGRLIHGQNRSKIHVLPICNCETQLPIEILFRRHGRKQPYHLILINLLRAAAEKENEEVRCWYAGALRASLTNISPGDITTAGEG